MRGVHFHKAKRQKDTMLTIHMWVIYLMLIRSSYFISSASLWVTGRGGRISRARASRGAAEREFDSRSNQTNDL